MRRLLIAFSTVLILTISACRPFDPVISLPTEISDDLLHSHVAVNAEATHLEEETYYTGRGSGITIADRAGRSYVLTALHAILPDEGSRRKGYTYTPRVWEDQSTISEAQVEAVGRFRLDAAVISYRPTGDPPPAVAISYRRPARREAVFIFGSPASAYRVTRRGRVAGACYPASATCYELATPVQPGFSGGGIYNGYGKLIGMTVARRPGDNNEGIFIPATALWPIITRALRNR